jgi:2-methylisocitrate lyase-like PEP mutase family enzyme
MVSEGRTPGARLRALLDRPDRVLAVLGIPSALQGQIMERAHVEAGFVGTNLTFKNVTGLPDTGVASANECVTLGGHIARAVSFPVILDGDTGHGTDDAVRRLVRDCVREGLAGLRIDDQPVETKRRTQTAGILVADREAAVARYRVAVSARDEIDPTFVIMAQCYARDADNGSPEEALDRLRLYCDEGCVDWCQLEAPHSVEEIQKAREAVRGYFSAMKGHLPQALTLAQHSQLGLDAAWYTFIPSRILMSASLEFLENFSVEGIGAWTAYRDQHAESFERLKDL